MSYRKYYHRPTKERISYENNKELIYKNEYLKTIIENQKIYDSMGEERDCEDIDD